MPSAQRQDAVHQTAPAGGDGQRHGQAGVLEVRGHHLVAGRAVDAPDAPCSCPPSCSPARATSLAGRAQDAAHGRAQRVAPGVGRHGGGVARRAPAGSGASAAAIASARRRRASGPAPAGVEVGLPGQRRQLGADLARVGRHGRMVRPAPGVPPDRSGGEAWPRWRSRRPATAPTWCGAPSTWWTPRATPTPSTGHLRPLPVRGVDHQAVLRRHPLPRRFPGRRAAVPSRPSRPRPPLRRPRNRGIFDPVRRAPPEGR